MITIKEVRTKKDMRKFVMFPVRLYRDVKNYVPNFYADEMNICKPKKNPSLKFAEIRCWLAYKDGKVAGRIAGIIQRQDNELTGVQSVRFSRPDFIEDEEVARKLFDTVAAWGREKGMTMMHGPWGFNDQDREGMLSWGYNQRSTMITNYSHPYYIDYVNGYGMQEECEWVEYRFEVMPDENDRVMRVARMVKERLHLRELAEELTAKEIVRDWGHRIFDLINESYANLNSYVPVEGEVVDGLLNMFGPVADRRFMSLLVNDKDELVGFSIAIPSIAAALRDCKGKLFPTGWMRILHATKHPKELEWLLIGVRPDYQARGLNAWMLARITKNAREDGRITRADSDCMLTTNTEVLSQLETLPHEEVRRRKCFKIDL